MALRTVEQIPLKGKRVFIRVDFNVPMDVFEMEGFAQGTISIAKAVAQSKSFSIVGTVIRLQGSRWQVWPTAFPTSPRGWSRFGVPGGEEPAGN